MPKLTAAEIITAIMSGDVDDQLDNILAAYRTRSRMKFDIQAAVAMTEVKIGSRVELINIRPKTLIGLVGEVVADPYARIRRGRRANSFAVKLDNPPMFDRHVVNGVVTGIPASCVKLVA